eukprot:Skav210294  [mRNA]  locus=scaffold475:101380:109066:- [translate_table: standard]
MPVSVDVPGYGHFSVPLTPPRTAGEVISLLQGRFPDHLWHGNASLSCGACQLEQDELVEAQHSTLVLANYSEISNTETWPVQRLFEACPIQDTAERGITREQLAKLVLFISKMVGRWCETFGEHRGKQLQFDTFNLYHANFWIIRPATAGYQGKGCSLVEIMAVQVQRPEWFAIEHREDNWSRRRLLLDVGATDFHGKATGHILGNDTRATEKIDKVRILNSIALTRLETCDFEHLESYPTGDPNFKRVDEALASHFALASWYGFVCEGRCADELVRAVRADTGRKTVELSFTGCRNFSDHELRVLLQSLPAELRVLRLDLAFSGLETMQMFAIGGLKSLVQLKLRFTGSTEFKTAAGLGDALREMKKLTYTPFLLVAIASVLLSSHFYPVDVTDFRCFPCRCWEKNDGAKHLSSCSLTGVLRFKDVSLREQGITSVATDAFKFSQPLQRLSLSKNRLGSLPRNLFAPLGNLQFLDLGSLGLQHLESDAFAGLSSLRVLSLSQNRLKVLPEDILQPMPALEQLLLGGKSTIVEGNGLSVLSKSLFKPTPWLRVLDLNRNAIASLPKGIFETTSLLRTLDLGGNNLNELHDDVFAGLHNLHSLYLNSNLLSNLSIGVFAGLTNLQTLTLSGLDRLAELPVGIFADLHNLQTLGLGWNSFKKLPVGIFAGLHNLQTLDLQSGTLKELPSGVFEDLSSLQMLDLRHTHRLNKLPVGVLAGLHNLQTLDLYNGGLWELPAGVFEDLYSLEMLNLKHNLNLDKLPVGVFAGLHNLRTLDLDGCRLKELPGGFFEDLHSLQALHLGELFDLKELPLGVFARLRNLQTLHLGEFDELPVDIFGGLRNLKTLSLRTNLNFLPVDIFAEQHNLEELQLSFYGTNLSKVPAKALNKLFAGLSKLKTLGLRFNRLGDLPAKALRNMFAELGNLQTLKLSYSNLGPKLKVWPSVLAGLSNLKVLDLEGNNLNQLPLQSWSTLFAQFKTLQTLNLERNNFTELPSFAQLRNLQELILNHNKLSDLPPGTFLGLSSLKVLKLEDNLLNKLPVAIFADLHNLQELVLDENKLSDLPAGIFEGLSHLKVLKLHYNKLNKLPVGIFAGLTNLQELSLWRNKLSELPVGIFAELHNLQILELFGNELAELDVGVFAGLTNLRGLYIHGNKLSELPVGVFEELHSLTFLQHDLRDVPAICSFIQCP